MRHYSLNQLSKMKHISDYLYDEDKNFTPERLITDLGLYEGVLIDTHDMKSTYARSELVGYDDYRFWYNAEVSDDVKALHRFLLFNESIMLPCAECKKEQAFSPCISLNPQRHDIISSQDSTDLEGLTIVHSINQGNYPNNSFNPHYSACKDKIELFEESRDCNPPTTLAALYCVEGISQFFSEIRRDFVCALNKNHHVTAYYTIHKAKDVCKKQEDSEEYEKLKYCLVLEKFGQEPSMADLQMFDIEKYKNILSKESFRNFSMALGLYASGVGCGSLLYLRRIFETLIKNAQDKCSSMPKWNEEEYNKRRFNEKIEYLEALGTKIIPDELSDVKNKIYGWLSKGVHELSEQESMEIFPYLKYAIELVLDEQITQNEKEDKLNELRKKLNK